jgi:hydrogenase-4 component B
MLSIGLILGAIRVLASSGLVGFLFGARSEAGQRTVTALMAVGGLLGLAGVASSFEASSIDELSLEWALPLGRFSVAIDPLGSIFLLLVFIVPVLASVYGLGYWRNSGHDDSGRRLGLFSGLLAASMAMIVISRDGVLFLLAWEAMALAAWFASTVDSGDREVRRAGWVYLIATHIGTLFLIAMFALWHRETGSFALGFQSGLPGGTGAPGAAGIPADAAGAIFVLALIGFGFKAGLMPLHFWLPGAHANAPSHVSAVMSGVMLKMGVYGIVRISFLLPHPATWWGGVLLGVGALTGIAGIAFAIGQGDLKRALAWSSIENIGIIAMGIGLALLGASLGRPDWTLLGLGGALLHALNHGLFKPLLFFNAGGIIHATGTHEIGRLGGLAKRMPRSAVLFVIGAVAISGLPPLNGFVSEWILYLGIFRGIGAGAAPGVEAVAIAAGALAMIGALALASFVRLTGAIFLGLPRAKAFAPPHDPPASMIAPMFLIAIACLFIGILPFATLPLLEAAVVSAALPAGGLPLASISSLVPLAWLTWLGLGLAGAVGLILALSRLLPRLRSVPEVSTWDCGYAAPTARMQYSGSSFGASLVGLFSFIVRARRRSPRLGGPFPEGAVFGEAIPDPVLDRIARPFFAFAGRYIPRIRVLQQGQTHLYVLYVLVITIVLLVAAGLGARS